MQLLSHLVVKHVNEAMQCLLEIDTSCTVHSRQLSTGYLSRTDEM
jgi:hypothetical protein